MDSVADLVEESSLAQLARDEAMLSQAGGLADRGRVRLVSFGPLTVAAEVEDCGAHTVELRSTGAGLRWSCSCQADRFCVHAAAAAIETWRRAPTRRA